MKSFLQFLIIGLGAGATYALFAQGAVLIYRGSGLVNFAQGAVGTFAAYIAFVELQGRHQWSIAPSIIVAVLAGGAVSLAFQAFVLRALRNAAAIVRVIATIGLLGLLQAVVAKLYGVANQPVDSYLPNAVYRWGGIVVQEERIYLVGITLVITFGLWAWTRYTRVGLAINASAQNERAVQTLGWSPDRLAAITWTLGGMLGGFAAVLAAPLTGLSAVTFTIVVTVAGLGAALLGGFHSFPLTLLGGLIIGVGESMATLYGGQITRFFHQDVITGLNRMPAFLVIFIVVVVRGRGLPLRSHVAERLPRLGSGEINVRGLLLATAVVVALLFGVMNDAWAQATYISLATCIMVLSIVVLTGYAGQISLAQWALAGVGALIAGRFVHAGFSVELSILLGVLLTIPVGLLFAVPALRTRGVNLAVVTLGLGYLVSEVVFANPHYLGGVLDGGTKIGVVKLFGLKVDAFNHPHAWAAVSLVAFVLLALLVANLRRSRTGRRLLAVRTNERAAASLGISVFGVKLYAFAVSAGLAAVAGILVGFRGQIVTYNDFNVFASIQSLGYAVIGGLGYVLGAVFGGPNAIGGLGTRVINDWIGLSVGWALILGSVLVFVILILNQNGIADVLAHARPFWEKIRLAPRHKERAPLPPAEVEPVAGATLSISGLTVRFSSVIAVDDVSLEVNPGEVVGLIGPNGAGKTTLIDAVTGFVSASGGSISLDGRSIEGLNATKRARLGLRRSFQSLELFEDVSVEENIRAGSDVRASTMSWVTDLFWPGRHELPPAAVAAVRGFDLEAHLDENPDALPYGRRRLVGIARTVASGPSIAMLDEPAAGLDETESVELARLIRRLADERNMGVLLVEHDVNLVMTTCDRVVVIDFGRVIASGPPSEVRLDPKVRDAYLGHVDEVEAAEAAIATADPAGVAGRWRGTIRRGEPVTDTLIEARQVSAGYGKMAVVRELDLHVDAGEVVALLGANGAGKTTTLLTLAGELKPLDGEVRFLGSPTTAPMHARCRNGLGYLTEERSVIMDMTVADNLKLAGVSPAVAFSYFPALERTMGRRAGLCSGGEQQMLSLARSLGREPKVLLADELSLGLAPIIVANLLEAVRTAADERGIGVLLVEQHVRQALDVADRAYVMERGRIVLSGTVDEVRSNLDRIEAAYLAPST